PIRPERSSSSISRTNHPTLLPEAREIACDRSPLVFTRRISRSRWGAAARILESVHRAWARASRLPRLPRTRRPNESGASAEIGGVILGGLFGPDCRAWRLIL